MNKIIKYAITTICTLIAGFIYYYITLPAINIHAAGFWFFLAMIVCLVAVVYIFRIVRKKMALTNGKWSLEDLKSSIFLKICGIAFITIAAIYIIGSILSSTFVNAKKYQKLLTIEERNFTDDIKEVDYNTIPLLDKASAALLGERKMGSMVDMVSQFEVGSDYTQINYNGRPVRVTPLVYASTIKWLTNQSRGIPAYIMIDMTTQNTECVKMEQGIRYSKSEHFNRNIYRHLRFAYPPNNPILN